MRPRTWRAWTRKELNQLEAMRLDGMTSLAIAARLHRTHASIRGRLKAEGIRMPATSRLKWLAAFAAPHTIGRLAAQFGVTKWAVKRAKNRLRNAGFVVPAAERRKVPA